MLSERFPLAWMLLRHWTYGGKQTRFLVWEVHRRARLGIPPIVEY